MQGPGLLLPADVVQRMLATPGAQSVDGLFVRPSLPAPSKPGRGASGLPSLSLDQLAMIDALAQMLRSLTNVNVRQPSTQEAPFRASNFYFRSGGNLAVPFLSPTAITFNGNVRVPAGSNVVIKSLELYVSQPSSGTTLIDMLDIDAGFANPTRLNVFLNGARLSGDGRVATLFQSQTIIGAAETTYQFPHRMVPLWAPIPLSEGDSLAFTVTTPTLGGLWFVEASGYIYPIEVEADGVRGTLADRG